MRGEPRLPHLPSPGNGLAGHHRARVQWEGGCWHERYCRITAHLSSIPIAFPLLRPKSVVSLHFSLVSTRPLQWPAYVVRRLVVSGKAFSRRLGCQTHIADWHPEQYLWDGLDHNPSRRSCFKRSRFLPHFAGRTRMNVMFSYCETHLSRCNSGSHKLYHFADGSRPPQLVACKDRAPHAANKQLLSTGLQSTFITLLCVFCVHRLAHLT